MSTVDGPSALGSPSSEPAALELGARADSDWPDRAVQYLMREQSGQELPV